MTRSLGPDRERLSLFLQQTERLLDLWVMQVTSGTTATHEDSLRLQAAWREVRPRFQNLKSWVRTDEDATPVLDRVGLAGVQLELKHQCCARAYATYMGTVDLTHVLRADAMRWTQTILASLADANPEAVAVREFLAAVEGMLSAPAR